MDLYRSGDVCVLDADIPGIDPGSVDIDVDGQLLTIRGERTLASHDTVKWLTRGRKPPIRAVEPLPRREFSPGPVFSRVVHAMFIFL